MVKHATKTSFIEKHGGWSKHRPTYQCWQDMKTRCYNQNNHNYKNYGARGIIVCERWRNSFTNFIEDMGFKPDGMTIERKNNNGNYEPTNCKWATRQEQRKNQRDCVYLEYRGQRMTVEEWGRAIGRHPVTLRTRIKKGYPIELILSPNLLLFGTKSPMDITAKGER